MIERDGSLFVCRFYHLVCFYTKLVLLIKDKKNDERIIGGLRTEKYQWLIGPGALYWKPFSPPLSHIFKRRLKNTTETVRISSFCSLRCFSLRSAPSKCFHVSLVGVGNFIFVEVPTPAHQISTSNGWSDIFR